MGSFVVFALFLFVFLSVVLCSLFPVCVSLDSIVKGQSISLNQTLTSADGTFALGFFTTSGSLTYLGIWYADGSISDTSSSRVVVWVANRESPLDSSGVLTLGEDGNLEILDGTGKMIRSSNVTSLDSPNGNDMNSTVGVLDDHGNFVLKHGGDGDGAILWQSFDHPSDTMVPGMKASFNRKTGERRFLTSWASEEDPRPGKFTLGVDPTVPTQCFIWKNNQPYWRSAILSILTKFQGSKADAYSYSLSFDGDEVYVTYSISDSNDPTQLRAVLTPAGQLKVFARLSSKAEWRLVREWPFYVWEFYNSCGPSAAYDTNDTWSTCKCLKGFEPKNQKEWDAGVWSGGCVRQEELKCDKKDGFLKFGRIKLPDHVVFAGNKTVSGCQSSCLKNCSCTAYAYSNLSQGNAVKCMHWFGDLVDLVQNHKKGKDLYVRLQLESSQLQHDNSEAVTHANKERLLLVIAVPLAAIALLAAMFVSYCFCKKRLGEQEGTKRSMSRENKNDVAGESQADIELVMFKFRSILAATDNFSEENKIGEGGFGPVYKGNLVGHQVVAIKRLSRKSGQGFQEFINELRLIAKLQHKNLVMLLGCCAERDEKILVYEYMPNRSLDRFIFDPCEGANLDWSKRMQIIEGIAQGLLYLHKYSRLKIIHRDLKASNILLDGAMDPKISDFGMARMFGIDQTEGKTNRVVGTYGYMSPEYGMYGKFSEKSDVFSFGVLLLEIVSGKKNTDFHRTKQFLTLLDWAWDLFKESAGEELIDPLIRSTCCAREAVRCIHIGLLCVQEAPADRPTMSLVVSMLSNEATLLPSPKQPAFSNTPSPVGRSSKTSNTHSFNELTMSIVEPR